MVDYWKIGGAMAAQDAANQGRKVAEQNKKLIEQNEMNQQLLANQQALIEEQNKLMCMSKKERAQYMKEKEEKEFLANREAEEAHLKQTKSKITKWTVVCCITVYGIVAVPILWLGYSKLKKGYEAKWAKEDAERKNKKNG